MKVDEIRQKSDAEIQNQIREGDEKRFRLRMKLKMGQTDVMKNYQTLRRDRARALTVLRERALAGE